MEDHAAGWMCGEAVIRQGGLCLCEVAQKFCEIVNGGGGREVAEVRGVEGSGDDREVVGGEGLEGEAEDEGECCKN